MTHHTARSLFIGTLLLVLCALAAVAQSDPPQPVPAVATDPVQVLDPVPDSPTKDSALWWVSVATNGMGTYLKWSSSWKQPIADVIHAEPSGPYQGRYYVRGTIYDWGTFGLVTVTQFILGRKFPTLRKTFSYVNFGTSAASAAQYGYNRFNH
jgi:hypothetical protein